MPRRRPPPQPPTGPSPSRSRAEGGGDEDNEAEQTQHSLLSTVTTSTASTSGGGDQSSRVPFYTTTFSCHRVSPLHLLSPSELDSPARLQQLAQRLRDTLVGDVVRGVEVGLVASNSATTAGPEENAMGRAGALEGVEVKVVGVNSIIGIRNRNRDASGQEDSIVAAEEEEEEDEDEDEDDEEDNNHNLGRGKRRSKKAMVITLRYEHAEGTAILFPSVSPPNNQYGKRQQRDTSFTVGVGGGGPIQDGDKMDIDEEDSDGDEEKEEVDEEKRVRRLPLLLMRMPAPLKSVVADFLAASFDCRVSPIRLGTRSITTSWERWIRTAGLDEAGGRAKDVVVTIGFNVSALARGPEEQDMTEEGGEEGEQGKQTKNLGLGIKTVDVIIPGTELSKFEKAGKRILSSGKNRMHGWQGDLKKRRQLAGRLREEGWEWRMNGGEDEEKQPFIEALASYLREHTAMDLFHPAVRVVKIACGGFVIAEGRLKIFKPAGDEQRRAAWELLKEIIRKAEVQSIG